MPNSAAYSPPGVTIAVLGLGEAGSAFATDLVRAGAQVRGYDPADVATPDGVVRCASEAEAVEGADLVISVNSAATARGALEAGMPGVGPEAVWADFNTGSPGLKASLLAQARTQGVVLVDVGIMAPVPGKGMAVPLLVSGEGASRVRELLVPLGADVTILPGEAGEAARRKLLRSVFVKSMGTALVEALEAAQAANCKEWLVENIAAELAEATPSTVDRLVDGTHKHAKRRTDEMDAATQMLVELGIEPHMAPASRDVLARLRDRAN
ncbi:MAG: DUF1932 domain-containing protein [Hyphomicrobiaceae bacterium]